MTMTAASVGPQQYGKVYEPTSSSVRQVRRDVSLALYTWGLDELVDDTQQIASELMANAIEHTDSIDIRTTITKISERVVRLEVTDHSPLEPLLCSAEFSDESGRGIALVDALSSKWGWENSFGGKKVWAEVTG
jgi:anti-sigma regulatory factor (Ser/Thr protein kinase)